MSFTARNMRTGEERTYEVGSASMAVITAYAHDQGDHRWWQLWKYREAVQVSEEGVKLGDWYVKRVPAAQRPSNAPRAARNAR